MLEQRMTLYDHVGWCWWPWIQFVTFLLFLYVHKFLVFSEDSAILQCDNIQFTVQAIWPILILDWGRFVPTGFMEQRRRWHPKAP